MPPTIAQRRGYLIQGAGDAGVPDPGVVTVQGDAAGMPLPVSGTVVIGGTVDVSDRAGRLLGVVSGAVDVTDRAARALGVVASVTAPVDVSDRAGRLLGIIAGFAATPTVDTELPAAAALGDAMANPSAPAVWAANTLYDPNASGGASWRRMVGDANGLVTRGRGITAPQIVTGGANAIATLTLAAGGAGLFHYITHLTIRRVATAALAGGLILTVATTNLNALAWRTGNQMSITVGSSEPPVLIDHEYIYPLRSAVANTATTIVCPAAGAAVSWHIVCHFYLGT